MIAFLFVSLDRIRLLLRNDISLSIVNIFRNNIRKFKRFSDREKECQGFHETEEGKLCNSLY